MSMINSLNARTWLGLLALAIVMGLLLFVPAGTIRYWQAWSYLGVFFGCSVLVTFDHRFKWSSVPLLVVVTGDAGTTKRATNPIEVARFSALFLRGTPLALGSYWGLLALPITLPGLLWWLFDEEKFLATNLPGYTEYCESALADAFGLWCYTIADRTNGHQLLSLGAIW